MDRRRVISVLGAAPTPYRLIVQDQTAEDIIRAVQLKHRVCASEYDKIAYMFAGGSVYDISQRIWDFLKTNIEYFEESEEDQRVSSPGTILARGWADCKGYALFAGGVLDALRRRGHPINWTYRFVCYKMFCATPSHVFVVVFDEGREIWIDPVLNSFDYHKPYWHSTDKKVVTGSAAISGCGCGPAAVGSTATTVSTVITAAAPALTLITGPAGPLLAIGAKLIGLFVGLFGAHPSKGVKWLDQKYQYYVLGQAAVTSDALTNDALIPDAQKWFQAVFGVPMYDMYRYHTLTGTVPGTSERAVPFPSEDQRAKQYLTYPEAVQAGITYDQALAAAAIGTRWPLEKNSAPGSWASFPVAGKLAAEINQGTGTDLLSSVSTVPGLVWIAAAALAIIILSSNN